MCFSDVRPLATAHMFDVGLLSLHDFRSSGQWLTCVGDLEERTLDSIPFPVM